MANQANHDCCMEITRARASAKYCCSGEMLSAEAESNPVSSQYIPVFLTLSTDKDCISPCECFTLSLTVSNQSDYTLPCPKLTLSLCGGMCLCPGSPVPNGVLPDIEPHSRETFEFKVRTTQNLPCCCKLCAKICFAVCDCTCHAKAAECVLHVNRQSAALQLQKSISPACCFTPNQCAEICIKVTNTGNTPLQEVKIVDELPEGLRYQAHSTRIGCGPAFEANPESGVVLDCLPPRSTQTITYCATAKTNC